MRSKWEKNYLFSSLNIILYLHVKFVLDILLTKMVD